MISRSEADDVFGKWISEGTRLRVDFKTLVSSLSVEGSLEPAASEIIRVRLKDSGFIEIHLDSTWRLEFFAPDAMRISREERLGPDHADATQETAAGMMGASGSSRLIVLEIVGTK